MISPAATIAIKKAVSDPLLQSIRNYVWNIACLIRDGYGLSSAVDFVNHHFPKQTHYFQIENGLSTFGLKNHFLFPEEDRIAKFIFCNRKTDKSLEITNITEQDVQEISLCLEILGKARKSSKAVHDLPYSDFVQTLSEMEIFVDNSVQTGWNFSAGSTGIYRLQHASFLLQTEKARVLIDPHFVSENNAELNLQSLMMPHNFNELNINAVLISHSHSDHYDLPSLMMMPRETLMIVPKVPKASILAPQFARELRCLGFRNVVEMDWYSDPVIVEDIEIRAFPFYGEQPLRYEHPRHPMLRNWGNSYVFLTPNFSTWCLIDSGADADGSMVYVADEVKKKLGEVDVVLANLHEFFVGVKCSNPFYTTGGGEYWLSLTADQMARFPELCKHQITLGPKGVAEICAIVGAKTFLPYAHAWSNFSTIPDDEPHLLEKLHSESASLNRNLKIGNWRIGDFWHP
ncbi:MAG TPA: MBL fold metallo-hydrolase [Acidobacteriota bacterium]|nr:MBL fold metallo-hydrolase [Acidobacteriota bacterium]